jgi:hypothetical protein
MAKKHDNREAGIQVAENTATDGVVTVGNVAQTAEPTAQFPLAVTISVPLADPVVLRPGLRSFYVTLTEEQSLTVQRVTAGLQINGEHLNDGRTFAIGDNGKVRGSSAHVMNWILEQIAAQVGSW